MRAVLDNVPARIRNPGAVRPWQHVLEPLGGYLLLAERLWQDGRSHAGAWNFGPGEDDARTVAWVADRVAALWGEGARWERDRAEAPPEAHMLRLDCAKARQILGWRPRWPLDTALAHTVDWYKGYAQAADLRALTLDQIDAYTREPAW